MASKLIGIASVAALSAIAVAALAAYRPAASPPPKVADKASQAAKADVEPCRAMRCEKPGNPAKEEDHDRDDD